MREIQGDTGWLSGGDSEPDAVANFRFSKPSFDDATKNTIAHKGHLTLMTSRNPFDIGVEKRNLRDLPYEEIHDRQVFSQKFLHDNGIRWALENHILNRIPIWKLINDELTNLLLMCIQ